MLNILTHNVRNSKRFQNTFPSYKSSRNILYFCLLISIVYIYREESCSVLIKIYRFAKNESNCLQTLETDITNQNTIFFIETRSNISPLNFLNKRESCSIESAALSNPNRTVYVLFSSAGPVDLSETALYVKAILQYPNVRLRRISMVEYMKGTPLETWYSTGVLNTSEYILAHTSDVLRLITLWKYGGVYLDLDTYTTRSLDGLTTPFIGLESDEGVANGVIGAPLHGIGHQVISNALQKLKETFRGDLWAENGPILLERTLRSVCNIGDDELADALTERYCQGFKVYPASYFYPVPYYNWMDYFQYGSEADTTMSIIKDSYIVHVWNKMSYLEPVIVDSQQPYARIARQFCPRVNQNSGKEF